MEGISHASAFPPTKEITRWIAALDERERVALLSRVTRGETNVGAELMRRFRRQVSQREAMRTLRTAGALRTRAEELAEQRREVVRAREANERLRREREQAAARDRHLSTLAKRQADAWRRVERSSPRSARATMTLRSLCSRTCARSANGRAGASRSPSASVRCATRTRRNRVSSRV